MMYYSDDPIADFNAYSAEQEEWLNSLPKCVCCGEAIQQDTAVHLNGDWYCDDCLDGYREEVNEEWDNH